MTYGVCFHAQQCAEKYLKAALVAKGSPFPKTHDLLALDTLCQQAGLTLGMDIDVLSGLSAYAITVRYPGEAPTVEEPRVAFETAKAVRRIVRPWLGLK